MSSPVNRISIKKKEQATFSGAYDLFIDRKKVSEALNDFWLATARVPFPNQKQCYVHVDALKKSLQKDGNYHVLVCSNCANSGYHSCKDLDIESIVVSNKDNKVTWTITWHSSTAVAKSILQWNFDLSEYRREIESI